MNRILLFVCMIGITTMVSAAEVTIEHAQFKQRDGAWKVDVTLRHADSGWDHYANEWRIVDAKGTVLARRVLAHPHVDEQPFTRSIHFAKIPAQTRIVFIEARDSVHGWSQDRIKVDLDQRSGDRYQVQGKDGGKDHQ